MSLADQQEMGAVASQAPAPDLSELLPSLASPLAADISADRFFILCCQQQVSSASSLALDDHIASLPASALPVMLEHLHAKLSSLLLTELHSSASTALHQAGLQLLSALVRLLSALLPLLCQQSPALLLPALQSLHDALLSFPQPSGAAVQQQISALLIVSLSSIAPCPLSLLPLLLPYLLLRTLDSPHPPAHLILSLYSLRAHFRHFDYADPSSSSLLSLLSRLAVHPPLLRRAEGRKLIASVMALGDETGRAVHAAVRAQLVGSRSSLCGWWGDVYYLAWKAADCEQDGADGRERVEASLQDWMHLALHCSSPRTHRACLLLLHSLHSQRRQPAVELMLARLYEPLLLRALSAPHPLLRQHAVSVLIDTFPLPLPLSPSLPPAVHLQQQLTQLTAAMQDAAVGVRVVSVKGGCLLLSLYWEAVGVERGADVLRQVLRLAEDAAAAVRVSVCDGMQSLLRCHPAHGLLRRLLPALSCLLHDRSPSVQQAYAALLLAVKPLRDLTYYSLSPLPSLLLALQHTASARLRSALCQLLTNSFFPVKGTGDTTLLVRRLLVAVRENGEGARVLYAGVGEWEEGEGRARLVLGLLQLLRRTANTARGRENEQRQQSRRKKKSRRGAAEQDEAREEAEAASEPLLELSNAQQVEHVVVILATLWRHLEHDAVRDTAAYRDVVALFTSSPAVFQSLLDAYAAVSSLTHSALLSLLPQLPASSSSSASSSVSLSSLSALSAAAPLSSFAPVLDCLLQWGTLPQLLLLMTRSIRLAERAELWTASRREREKAMLRLEAEERADRQRRQQDNRQRQRETAAAAADEEARYADIARLYLDPLLSLRFLSHLLSSHRNRALLLSSCTRVRRSKKTHSSALIVRSPLLELLRLLDGRLERLLQLLRDDEEEKPEAGEEEKEWLCAAAELLLKARIHLHGEEREKAEQEEADGWEMRVAAWPAGFSQLMDAVTAAVRCLPASSSSAAALQLKKSRAAPAAQLHQRTLLLAVQLSTDLLALGCPHAAASAASVSVASCLHSWLTELSGRPPECPAVAQLLPALYKLLYHITVALTSHPAFSAADWPQDSFGSSPSSSASCSSLPCSYALYADTYRLLSAITHSASEAVLSSLTGIVAAFRSLRAEQVVLNIVVNILPFVASSAAERSAPLLLACAVLASSPLYLSHLPSLLLSVLQQARGAGMAADVMRVIAAIVRQLVLRLDARLKESERKAQILSLLLDTVREMKASEHAEEAERELETVRGELEAELGSRWKASGGGEEAEAETVIQ